SHLIIGRDHASPPPRPDGTPFYPTDAAQQLLMRHADEIGVTPVALPHMAYVETIDGPDAPAADRAGAAARIRGGFQPRDAAPAGARVHALSGRALRQRLADGAPIPPWFTPPEVAAVLRRRFPPRHARGFAVLLTGLSGAGKSTLARALKAQLEADDDPRSIHLLDGDAVRRMLSSELGFSAAHRDLNVRRIGFVAAEIVRAGGIALCAPIAPYDAARRAVRQMIEAVGGFALVHVATPLAVCETRDPKGLYRQARAGAIARFTGVSDPYEPPRDAEIVVDAGACTPEAAAERVRAYLRRGGYFPE
ncbi:MAG: adenylyl-sulfate kinase, partial [Acidobacteriota bacterium]